ncbi:MAG: YndJ family transporter [Prosthecobacter sp.]|uniref:YndJ family transporter n=1 Tax=Prosthecobacter sp. TaxID=1965333 RepID=UPI003BAFB9D2
MNVWIRLIAWASIVVLHYAVLWASPAGCCGMGMVDSDGPIWMIHVNEPDIWIHALLMLSVLVLMPLGGEVGGSKTPWMEVISAYLLGLSLLVRPVDPRVLIADDPSMRRIVPLGFLLSVPWLWVQARAAFPVVTGWLRHGISEPARLCLESARVFPSIGAAWLVAHRANWAPWGFDPLIVLLTAAHFHHAGFTLPLMAGLNAKANPGCWTRFSCAAILLGVPLVAVGITGTHFGVLRFMEPFGVVILVLGALGVAVSQVWRGLERQRSIWTRIGFLISGASLFAAMVLALGFGLRYVIPNFALTMPQMWAIHGTLNAFGFGLCGILAWRGAAKPISQ